MTVLVCIPCLLTGGTEIQTLSLVEAIAAAGHRPVVACYFEFASEMVERYIKAGAEVELLSPDGTRPAGVKATFSRLWRGLKHSVRKHHPDIAHVQYMAPGALPIIALRLLGVKKIIATAHTSADIYPSLRQIHWLNRRLLTAFQCITLRAEESFFGSASLFTSETTLLKHGNHFTIYNNLPSYMEIIPRPRTGQPLTIGVVSRLEPIKGMDWVVPAFAKVLATHPGMRLLVVGDGSQRRLMERQVEDLQVPADKVEFTGRQQQDALQTCYDRIDILLMPSRSEGFGLTAIEGMARGCVPVVSRVGGLPEVVEDGSNGITFTPGTPESLADAILEAVIGYGSLSECAVKRAADFSRERYNRLIAALYDAVQNK